MLWGNYSERDEIDLLILVFLVQCFNEDGEQSCGGDVLESEKNPYQDRWKFSGWLYVIRPWGLSVETVMGNSMTFAFLTFHLKMQIMDEINCKLCKSQRSRSGKTVINEPPQWQCSTKCCIEEWNWKEQMQNIGSEEIQVDNSNKSNWTASLQKGGQTGGGVSGGSPEKMCEENFYRNGLNLFSMHRRFQLYPFLHAQIFLLLWKGPSKLKSHFFRGSFSRLTFQVRRGPCLSVGGLLYQSRGK